MTTLPERIGMDNAKFVLQQLLAGIDQADTEVTVDLSTITHCDSAGIAALIEAKSYALRQQKPLTYSAPPSQLRDLAVFLKVEALLF